MTVSELPETVPIATLAGLFGVTDRQARNLLEMSKVKSRARGHWPLAEAVRAVLAQARESREPDQLSAARARALNAKAKAQEVALARTERDLIPLEEAIAVMDELCAVTREVLIGLPARITRDLDLRRKIEAEVHAGQLRIVRKLTAGAAALREGTDDVEEDAA
jgi:hypothetical protein